MARVVVNVMEGDWSVNFIGTDGQTRIGPWLLCDSADEVRAILRWCEATASQIDEHDRDIRRWGVSSTAVDLPFRKVAALIERGKGWPWNGYELKKMKVAGKYPPQRL
jgi:hypothetical protein